MLMQTQYKVSNSPILRDSKK